MSNAPSPAAAARSAMAAVCDGQRERWLDGFSEDCRVEDPVGHLPPLSGRAALADFWDVAIGTLSSVDFEITREWEAGAEAVLLATVSIVAESGASATYDGVFQYALGDDGKIASLRAFWDLPAVASALTATTPDP
jgi:ketosteroid isomerase-like protein